jgi:aspartate racemase
MNKVGLIGGISWISTIDYYRYINEAFNDRLGGLNFAECIIYSLNFGRIYDLGWANAYPELQKAAKSLKKAGANCLVLCANTAHFTVDALRRDVGLPILSIVSATRLEIQRAGLKRVGLLGTRLTMGSTFYIDELKDDDIECILPQQEERDFIQETLANELGRGIIKEETRLKYLQIMRRLVEAGAEGVILGCTEIPLLIQQSHIAIPIFDTTRIHCNAIAEYILSRK